MVLRPTNGLSPALCPLPGPVRKWKRAGGWLSLLAALAVAAAEVPVDADRAREALVKMFEDGLHEFVERDATDFAARFPDSPHLAEVLLLQGRSRLALGRYEDALSLLEGRAAGAGALAFDYAFSAAEARLRKGDYAAAAEGFARLAAQEPESPRGLEAAVAEARARLQAGDTAGAAARLRDPAGPFQTAARALPAHPRAHRGRLLLGQLLIELKDLDGAREVLHRLAESGLSPALEWERRASLARAEFLAGQPTAVLAQTTNLWTAVTNELSAELVAEAALLEGRAFEQQQQPLEAVQSYERVLDSAAPLAQRRLALERIVALTQPLPNPAPVLSRLEQFAGRHPDDPLRDLARLALGYAYLREHQRLSEPTTPATPEMTAARTNRLLQARAQFDLVLTNAASEQAPRAELGRAWTLWQEGTSRLAEALAAFRNAAQRLPPSGDQLTARFQWAECQLQTGDAAGALTNFWQVATNSMAVQVPAELRAQGLFGVVRAATQLRDMATALAAADQLLARPGAGELAEQADLLIAETYTRARQPEEARAQYEAFLKRHPDSPRVPEVRLAIARAFEMRGDLGAARAAYTAWLASYTNHPTATGLVARAAFELAKVAHRMDPGPESLALLTNFVARFPGDPRAPLAQYLVAEHYLGQGEYARAELAFLDRLLDPAQARPGEELPFRARLMAGKAAAYRQGWQNARDHFDWLITNGPLAVLESRVPAAVVTEAYLLRGDLFILEPRPAGADPLASYAEALNAFAKITEHFPDCELAPRAWGRIGDCNLQLATADPRRYDAAAEAYRQVMESPRAGPDLRSMAEVGLGIVRSKQARLKPPGEQQALLDEAMTHFLNVLYERNLRPGEVSDPPWVRQAGLEAVELAESRGQFEMAAGLCERLIKELPPLRRSLEQRLEALRRLAAGRAGTRP